VANFQTVISFCTGYGNKYVPSQTTLTVANLQTQWIAADDVMDDCKKTETACDNAIDIRRDFFADVRQQGTKIVNALVASGVADSVVEGARTINRKIQGQRATPLPAPKKAEDGKDITPKTISSSQQGFDSLVEHVTGMIELVSSQPEYGPNEEELKVASLQTYLAGLKTTNTNVINANTTWSNDRIKRDELLYADKTGVVDTCQSIKNYIKSAFGATSPQYKQVSGLLFKKISA
jgi:hypothetical protein